VFRYAIVTLRATNNPTVPRRGDAAEAERGAPAAIAYEREFSTLLCAIDDCNGWRERMGRRRYPHGRKLTITADCGGSNGARVRLWKLELQKLADETGLVIHVYHYPPGTSKLSKIEDLLFRPGRSLQGRD
jgi:hypothetical protein